MFQRLLETRELQRQRPFLRAVDACHVRQRIHIDSPLCEHALDARVGVLQIGRGVAVEGEHRFPVEDVVAGAVLRQVGVLHRTDANRAGDYGRFGVAELGILGLDQRPRPHDRFVQEIEQPRAAALARLEGAPVAAEHGAEGVVLERHASAVAGGLGEREQLPKVQRLARVHDVQHAVGAKDIRSVAHGGEVRGVVEVAAVGLAHDHRLHVAVAALELVQEDAERAVGFPQQTFCVQVRHDAVQIVVEGALAAHVLRLEARPQRVVDDLAMRHGDVDVAPPTRQRRVVALLQCHHRLPGALRERFVGVEALARLGVEAFQIGEFLGVFAAIVQVRHQAPEAGAPVADVVLPQHGAAKGFQDARHRVADDGAAQVVDLHLLGQIGMRIVDHHALAQRLLQNRPGEGFDQHVVGDRQADEARARHRAARRDVGEAMRGVDCALREAPWILPQALRGAHRAVGLVVAELRAGCDAHHRRRRGADLGKRGFEGRRQCLLEIHADGLASTSSACRPRSRSTATKVTGWPSASVLAASRRPRMALWWTNISSPLSRTTNP